MFKYNATNLSLKQILLLFLTAVFIVSSFLPFSKVSAVSSFYSANDIMFYDENFVTASCGGIGDVSLAGNDNIEKAFNYFVAKGLTPEQSAGILGNLEQESGLDPTIHQGRKNLGKFPQAGVGYGIAQWTPAVRQDALVAYAEKNTVAPNTLKVQLEFLWGEATGDKSIFHNGYTAVVYAGTIDAMKNADTVADAAFTFHKIFERSADTRAGIQERIDSGKAILQKYGDGSLSGSGGFDCSGSGSTKVTSIAQQEYKKNVSEYDENVLKYTNNNRYAWCASFVSWVFKEAGQPFTGGTDGGYYYAGVLNLMEWFKSGQGGSQYFAVGQQKPQPGDVAFYVGAQTPDGGSTEHVNIVIKVSPDGKTMTTIGGNESDQLKKSVRKVELGAGSLVGFGRR